MSFSVTMRGGVFSFDERFRPELIDALATQAGGYLRCEYDNCLLRIEDVLAYEDDEGTVIIVKELIYFEEA